MTTTKAIINATAEPLRQGRYKIKAPTRGGARPNAGRPKGSTALITAKTLVEAIEQQSGRPFEEMLAEGYQTAVRAGDSKTRLEYERMILGKVVSDRTAVEVTNTEEDTVTKAQAFAEALGSLVTVRPRDNKGNQ